MDKLSERLTKECDRITSRQYMGADRWVNTFAHSTEVRALLAEAIELAKRYEDAPVGFVMGQGLLTQGAAAIVQTEKPGVVKGQRVRIVLDKEG